MQTTPSVAICIPTFNQAQYLPMSVGSACQQTYQNIEVWVSDDASTDETPHVMTQLCQQFPQVSYYRQPQNLGIVGNNNWLLSQPKAEFIIRLDSDDLLMPNYVERLVNLLECYPDAGYAHAAVQEINEYGDKQGIRQLARTEEFRKAETELRAAVSGFRMAANVAMFRSDALRKLSFYEGRPEYTEDYDLIVRMADAGYGNVYTNEVLACYRVWTDASTVRPRRKSLELQGMIRIYEESLLPAFQRRGWDTQIITQKRRQLALIHSAFCYRPLFTEAERNELIELVKKLGDSPALQFRLLTLRWGLSPFFEWRYSTELKLKRLVKAFFNRLNKL
ncbi:glycosyl transferase family 2 [Crinalium epipsammum PCC 9333]|uniref:Glycosyl transferase family 2 n=1 Tax=Crinalium epipsammum PCC 9333 TaxID=1173022 RepID=K9W2I0_9CYAN|nr:glycosyltransferase family 2 protein [Crinalium epipsammum]AFZ13615.1 glycosyl transferase family 2 [Crinalium epipsammum PCC 9333]